MQDTGALHGLDFVMCFKALTRVKEKPPGKCGISLAGQGYIYHAKLFVELEWL